MRVVPLAAAAAVALLAHPATSHAQWLPGHGPTATAQAARPKASAPPGTPGTLLVELILGPITKIAGPGEKAATPPVRGARVDITDSTGTRLGGGVTNADGRLQLSVRPGGGRIWVRTCPGAGGQLPPAIGYSVRPGGGTGVTIACKSRP